MKLGIVVLATNAYFAMGIRFIKKFLYFYEGSSEIVFYFFSDENPKDYLPNSFPVEYFHSRHASWQDGTNSKFKNIVSLQDKNIDFLYYFDADTNVDKSFTEQWFLGDLVGGEHFMNKDMSNKPYDNNLESSCFVDPKSDLERIYYLGAFFGGKKNIVINLCKTLIGLQLKNKEINHEPPWNDESYLNYYFHYNKPQTVVLFKNFPFIISDKGSLSDTRNVNIDISTLKNKMKNNKNKIYDLQNINSIKII